MLGTDNIVRVMPNTPALINEGISIWYQNKSDDQKTRTFCQETFSLLGT